MTRNKSLDYDTVVLDQNGCIRWEMTLIPCSHGCILGKPKGMATNGGCAHLQLSPAETRRLLQRVAMKLRAYQEAYDE